MRITRPDIEDPELQVASLIDMTFLLLVYFLVAATLTQSEADLGIRLPGMVQAAQQVDMTDEQIVEIREKGQVVLNGQEFDSFQSQDLPQLVNTLVRYKQSSAASKNEAMVTIWADDASLHQRTIDVMNACARAGVSNVTFTASGE
jgi:biopolymer transport protein ExbD